MRLLLLITALLALTSCGRGTMITGDGRVLSVTPENVRLEQQRTLVSRATDAAGPGWTATATIAELPVVADDAFGHPDNHWERATVTITLTGHGDLPAERRSAVIESVRASMRPQVRRSATNLSVSVVTAAPAAQVSAPPALPPTTGPSSARSYVIQAGDTVGDLSAVFYGDAKHWRLIVEANPGLDPAGLRIGQTIVVPPRPVP